MTTPEQRAFFQKNGFLLLKGALSKSHVEPIRAHVFGELKRLKIWPSGKKLSVSKAETPAFQQITKHSQQIKYPGLQSRLITTEIQSIMNALAGVPLTTAQDAQFLISLPNQGEWRIHRLNWHVDISSSASRLPGIQAFVLIDDVKPYGGATMAVAGSHALSDQSRQRARETLGSDGDIEKELASLNLSILEMSGQAGDVYLMDMRLLHTPSINSTTNLRLMATARHFVV